MTVNNNVISVQHNVGFLPGIILLTQCYYRRGCKVLSYVTTTTTPTTTTVLYCTVLSSKKYVSQLNKTKSSSFYSKPYPYKTHVRTTNDTPPISYSSCCHK